MQKYRVVHILPGLGLGGTEKVGQLIACGLDPAAFEVAVYSPTDGPRGAAIRAAGIPLIIHKDMTPFVRTFAPDIIHIHRGGWPDPKLMRCIRGVLRYNPDGSPHTRVVETNVFGRFDDSPAGRLVDCTVFVSHFCARRYGAVHTVDIALPRYTTIYNPVETDFLATHIRSPQQRDYSLPVVGRLSRADKGKWSTLAMDMLPPLVERVPELRYAIVGGIDSARDFVQSHGLQAHVDFLPPVEDLPQLAHFLDGLSVFAHANDTGESFGLVIAEAMAAGLPVVTHPCPLPKDNAQLELVEHEVTGLVAQTATDYADAVAWLLRHPEHARRMGMAGQAKAAALYSVAVVVAQWERLYAALCPEPAAHPPSIAHSRQSGPALNKSAACPPLCSDAVPASAPESAPESANDAVPESAPVSVNDAVPVSVNDAAPESANDATVAPSTPDEPAPKKCDPAPPVSPAISPAISPLVQIYSEQVLQWQLGAEKITPPVVEDAARARQTATRLIANAERAGHSHVLILGMGDGSLAHCVLQALPATCTLLVLEDSPAVARAALASKPALRPHVLVDSSPWALFVLCQALGVPRDRCSLCYNPAYPRRQAAQREQPLPPSTSLPVLEQWRRLFLGAQPVAVPGVVSNPVVNAVPTGVSVGIQAGASAGVQAGAPAGMANTACAPFPAAGPRLSVACIAHPDESLLPEFLGHIPPWVHEVAVVWDGQSPPNLPPCAVPLKQAVRPLHGDFAAQRNAMLELCTGDWCLYLDVDEKLDAATWAAIPTWLSLPPLGTEPVGAIVLPRLTFMGDTDHVRMGYGLWPDVQMRLFPLHAGLHFVGAVHEQIKGIQGATLLMGGHPIWHYSHIRKDASALQARLRVFNDAAAEGTPEGERGSATSPRHVLSAAYPRLPVGYFTGMQGLWRLPL